MSDTPGTDKAELTNCTTNPPEPLDLVEASFARQLERELAAANQRVKELEKTNKTLHSLMVSGELRGVEKATEEWDLKVKQLESKIQRLIEAGDAMHETLSNQWNGGSSSNPECEAWTAAKEENAS